MFAVKNQTGEYLADYNESVTRWSYDQKEAIPFEPRHLQIS